MRVDFHTHIIPEDIPNFVEKFSGERWPTLEKTMLLRGKYYGGWESVS